MGLGQPNVQRDNTRLDPEANQKKEEGSISFHG
jgi:hypothetical protein